MQQRIGFIGGGNMATSLIGGLVATGHPADHVLVSEPNEERRAQCAATFGVQVSADNNHVAANADILVLAVKPNMLPDVMDGIAAAVQQHKPLVISIAVGVTLATLARHLGEGLDLVRTMPNTPSLVRAGVTGAYAPPATPAVQREHAQAVLSAVGSVHWVDSEQQLDALSAVSGSGPAYFFYVIEAMEAAAVELGLPAAMARELTLGTALGAAKLALHEDIDPAELRRRVTSPGGTTQAAIETMEAAKLKDIFRQAMTAAVNRAAELARS